MEEAARTPPGTQAPAPPALRDAPDAPAEDDIRIAPGVVVRRDVPHFAFASSSGPGGQNVNKRETKCVMRIALAELPLEAEVLARLCRLAPRYITEGGEIVISSDEHRSQERNKAACIERFRELAAKRSSARASASPPSRPAAARSAASRPRSAAATSSVPAGPKIDPQVRRADLIAPSGFRAASSRP